MPTRNHIPVALPTESTQAEGAILLRTPDSEEAAQAGVVRHFTWHGKETDVSGDISRGEAGLVVSRVEITAQSPVGLTHRLLRLPLGEVLAQARVDVARSETEAGTRPTAEAPIPPGRVLMTDDLLRRVAITYLEETESGGNRAVLQRMADRLGRSRGTVRTWLGRAREEGWLGPGVQGRPGAEPGPKLIAERVEELGKLYEIGPHPEDEPIEEKIAREARRMRMQNEAIRKWEAEQ
jgi:transposase